MAGAGSSGAYERLREEFDEFLHYLPDGFIEADLASGQVTHMNRLAAVLLGFDPEDPPESVHGSSILAEGEFERLYAHHAEVIQSAAAQGLPYQRMTRPELMEVRMKRTDGTEFTAEFQGSYVMDGEDLPVGIRFIFRDITDRKAAEDERAERLRQLERLLPICAWCKRIRDDAGGWHQLETYIHDHAGYDFTHSICPNCEGRMDVPSPEPPPI